MINNQMDDYLRQYQNGGIDEENTEDLEGDYDEGESYPPD